jgi:hypothetical protein
MDKLKFTTIPLYVKSNQSTYTPYNPTYRQELTYPVNPNIIKDSIPRRYDFSNQVGGGCTLKMKIKFDSDPENPVEFNFQLEDYVSVTNDYKEDLDTCEECDKMNQIVYDHNQYMVCMLTELIKLNGCKVSAGVVTQPDKPSSKVEELEVGKQSYLSNRELRLKNSIEYLLEKYKMLPVKDYDINNAIDLADVISFYYGVSKRIRDCNGNLRLRFPNSPPVYWNGVSENTSIKSWSNDIYDWCINKNHCVKFPCIKARKKISHTEQYVFEGVNQNIMEREGLNVSTFEKYKEYIKKNIFNEINQDEILTETMINYNSGGNVKDENIE